MATRKKRIDAFSHEGVPPADLPLEVLCEDHVGTYVIPFLCRWSDGIWHNVDTGNRVEATVVGGCARADMVRTASRILEGLVLCPHGHLYFYHLCDCGFGVLRLERNI